jgi:hypothetical protein
MSDLRYQDNNIHSPMPYAYATNLHSQRTDALQPSPKIYHTEQRPTEARYNTHCSMHCISDHCRIEHAAMKAICIGTNLEADCRLDRKSSTLMAYQII